MTITKISEYISESTVPENNKKSEEISEKISKKINWIIKWRNSIKILKDFIKKNIWIIVDDISKCDFSELENKLWTKIKILYKKIKRFDHTSIEYDHSADSSVLALNNKQALKVYDRLWIDQIKRYSNIQNEIAWTWVYNFNLSWEIRWKHFDSIEIDILKLDPKLIFWNNYYSFSVVDLITPIQTEKPLKNVHDFFDIKLDSDGKNSEDLCKSIEYDYDDEYLTKWIINHINVANKDSWIIIPSLHNMNFMVRKIENWVLYVTITDIWNTIWEFLEQNKDYFEK